MGRAGTADAEEDPIYFATGAVELQLSTSYRLLGTTEAEKLLPCGLRAHDRIGLVPVLKQLRCRGILLSERNTDTLSSEQQIVVIISAPIADRRRCRE